MNRLIAYILFSPLVWWASATMLYSLFKGWETEKLGAATAALFFLLAFWATYFV